MPSRNYTLFFIFSVGFVLISIAFITILGQTSKADNGNVDIRAKATVVNSLKLVGTIAEINDATRTIKVTNLKFESKADEEGSMGDWMVTAPAKYDLRSVGVGKNVFINGEASTFNTANKTMTALAISAK